MHKDAWEVEKTNMGIGRHHLLNLYELLARCPNVSFSF